MHVNRKLGRFKQWAGERMGGEVKTNLSDDFKAMETEMNVRHEGVDRIHKSMNGYVKSISKRNEGDDKEKTLPIAHLGGSMICHGEDFDANSEYGRCMTIFGRAEERLARIQESYIAQANSSWLESLERSLTQMKDFQSSRKKLDSRRLAYDTSLAKMEKAKKEDFRVEEELRTQKVKYEEATEDVYRRMQDIREAEADGVVDLTEFLEAQLNYHERCREVLLQLKNDWPGGQANQSTPTNRRPGRTRSITAHSLHERYEPLHEEPHSAVESRPIIRSNQTTDTGFPRPVFNRTPTFEGPSQLQREQPFGSYQLPSRAPSENYSPHRDNSQMRPASRVSVDPYMDPADDVSSRSGNSPDRAGRSVSPAPSQGSVMSRRTSASTLNGTGLKKGPPPPPPSRAKKPPPPPPPMKKNLLGVGGA